MVVFFDEGRFGLQPTTSLLWAQKGQVPNVEIKQGYKYFYIYSSVSPFGGEDFTLFLPWVNTKVMNFYLDRLSNRFSEQEILMIMDNARWHKSKSLYTPQNITIDYLPPYSPELNPVEKLWQWFRQEVTHNWLYHGLEGLMDALQKEYLKLDKEFLSSLCNCSYFSQYN